MGLGAMFNAAKTAGLQGIDLFGAEESRIIAGFELHARYINDYLDKVASLGGAQPPRRLEADRVVVFSVRARRRRLYKAGWEVAYSHYASLGVSPCRRRSGWSKRVRPSGPGSPPPVLGDPDPRSLRLTRGGRRPPGRALARSAAGSARA